MSGRRWRLIGMIALMLVMSGCLDYDEQILLHSDGSGELLIHYEAAKDMRFHNLYFPTDVYDVEKNIRENYLVGGMELLEKDVREKGDRTRVLMRFRFRSLDALNRAPRFQDERFTWSRRGRVISFKRFIYMDESKLREAKLLAKAGIEGIFKQEVLGDIHFRFQVIFPGTVVSSNADVHLDENQLFWERTLAEILREKGLELRASVEPYP